MDRKTEQAIVRAAMLWYHWHTMPPFNIIAKQKSAASGGPLFRACDRAVKIGAKK